MCAVKFRKMQDILKEYKGDQSNYDCIKAEIKNLIDELENVNRLKVTREFANDVLSDIKSIRLQIYAITY